MFDELLRIRVLPAVSMGLRIENPHECFSASRKLAAISFFILEKEEDRREEEGERGKIFSLKIIMMFVASIL